MVLFVAMHRVRIRIVGRVSNTVEHKLSQSSIGLTKSFVDRKTSPNCVYLVQLRATGLLLRN